MRPGIRSLNVAVAAGIALAEALRQTEGCGRNDRAATPSSKRRATGSKSLRDRICAEFEAIEREAGGDAALRLYALGPRPIPTARPAAAACAGLMKGKVFEKVGVNVSTVGGRFEAEFAKTIHGAGEDPRFFATGISLVAHMANPHVPAVHMNTRFLRTTKRWFGGGADLNPPIPYDEDTADFHARLRAACDAHDPTYLSALQEMGGRLFLHPPPQRRIAASAASSTIISKGRFRRAISPSPATSARRSSTSSRSIVRRRMDDAVRPTRTRARQLAWRGRYAEFNLRL